MSDNNKLGDTVEGATQPDTQQMAIVEELNESDLTVAEQRQVLIMRIAVRQAMQDFAATPSKERDRGEVYRAGFHWLKLAKNTAVPISIIVLVSAVYVVSALFITAEARSAIGETVIFWTTVACIGAIGVCSIIVYREYFKWKYTQLIADRISTMIVTPSSRILWLVGDTQSARTGRIDNFIRKQNLLELMLKLDSASITADTPSTEDQFLKPVRNVKNADQLEKILKPVTSMKG